VDDYARLAQHATEDRRAVRTAVDALAHPGKLRKMPASAHRAALERLHAAAQAQDWTAVAAALPGTAALRRLQRLQQLQATAPVQRWLALCAQGGPQAGSDAAAAQGRVAARAGEAAEQAVLDAFRRLAAPGEVVVRGLRTPRGFPAAREGAKDEFDVAVVRGDALVLLAEVKASPAAATGDLPRLLRGLERLAQADADVAYTFACEGGAVTLAGASLRRLQPAGEALPSQVFYACTAPAERQPALLGAAAKAMLLQAPASLAFALQPSASHGPLRAVWDALPRMPGVLQQYEMARAAREAMVHPDDLHP
jgi:hypothetical protein